MKQYQELSCPKCQKTDLVKNGRSQNGTQRYCCKSCKKYFLQDYSYKAWESGMKDKIDEQILNSGGVRDTARVLKINKNTVISHLKKKVPKQVNPYLLDLYESGQLVTLEIDIYYRTEWDEFWSFVGSKANKRWTWYIVERNSGVVVAWQNGDRSANTLQKLLGLVQHLPISVCYTDNWAAYFKLLPERYFHIIGKDKTWKIERKNLNFRTHLKRLSRRTICFSKNEDIHDNVIGMYIEKYYFKSGTFGDYFENNKRA